MRLASGSLCFVWGSMAVLLYAGAAIAEVDQGATFTDLAMRATIADPVAPAEPELQLRLPEATDKCVLAEDCIDQYLWSMYERARKIDTIRVQEPIRVTVRKKGHIRTVTKTVVKLVDEDFTWKDPKAAQRAGLSLVEYVIGGMDRDFKARLYHLFRALDDAGLEPGMTSGFRDNYRQSIASGTKAATDKSYHGGTLRGGFGHGLAADLVSVKGETRSERWLSSESLWKWIDEHGKVFGIGRPYHDRDPPHVGPINGKEYTDHLGVNTHRAGSYHANLFHSSDSGSRHAHGRASPVSSRIEARAKHIITMRHIAKTETSVLRLPTQRAKRRA